MSSLLTIVVSAVGVGVVTAVLYDLVVTTIAASAGAGPLTRTLCRSVWRGVLAWHRRRGASRAMGAAGPILLVSVLVMWLVGLIVGWALVFGREGSLLEAESGDPTALLGKVYFAAATVLGRGTSLYSPGTDLWRTLEQVAGATGVALLGLSIAYILAVVNAAAQKREVAAYVSSLGGTPVEVLSRAWDGERFGDLHLHLIALTPMATRLAQHHLAYPILHYFHSNERFTALGPSIVVLDEALSLAEEAVEDEHRLDPSSIRPCRAAIDGFLRTLTRVAVVTADHPLPQPHLAGYRDARLPLRPDDEIRQRFEALADRRRLLAGFLEHDGWDLGIAGSFDHDRRGEPTEPDAGEDHARSPEAAAQDDAATHEETSATS